MQKNWLKSVVTGTGLCLLVAAVMLGQLWQGEYQEGLMDLEAQSASENQQPSGDIVGNQTDVALFEDEEILVFIDEADAAAQAVAAAQNQMVEDVRVYASSDASRLDSIKQQQEALKAYCTNTAFSSWLWYSWGEDWEGVSWTGVAAKDYAGTEVPVVWLCRTEDGRVLAYARAIYHADTGLFEAFQKGTTTLGMQMAPYEKADLDGTQDDRDVDEFMSDLTDLLDKNGILPESMGGDFDMAEQPEGPVPAGEGTGVGSGIQVK